MSTRDVVVSYRCANCQYRVSGIPPQACPVCQTQRFEAYQPFELSKMKFFVLATVCCVYWIVTRMIVRVYDPIWMAISGFREGYPSSGILGVFLCGIMVPGMLCWLIYPRKLSYAVSVISCILWAAFCACMWVYAVSPGGP